MNKKEIFRKIGGIISEVTEQYQYLTDNFEDFNELELELFAANAHFLTEHIEILKKFASVYRPQGKTVAAPAPNTINNTEKNQSGSVNLENVESNTQTSEIKAERPSDSENVLKNPDFDSSEDSPVEERSLDELYASDFAEETASTSNATQEGQSVIKDPEPVPSPVIVPEPLSKAPSIEPTPEAAPATAPAPTPVVPVVEAFTEARSIETVTNTVVIPEKDVQVESNIPAEKESQVRTLNDVISAQINKGTVSTAYTRQTTDDLKAIISLNDKLLFIKELFNGYSLAYSEAIEILNRFESLEAAENFLRNNYAEKNQWVAKQSAVDKFFKLLERRYAK